MSKTLKNRRLKNRRLKNRRLKNKRTQKRGGEISESIDQRLKRQANINRLANIYGDGSTSGQPFMRTVSPMSSPPPIPKTRKFRDRISSAAKTAKSKVGLATNAALQRTTEVAKKAKEQLSTTGKNMATKTQEIRSAVETRGNEIAESNAAVTTKKALNERLDKLGEHEGLKRFRGTMEEGRKKQEELETKIRKTAETAKKTAKKKIRSS